MSGHFCKGIWKMLPTVQATCHPYFWFSTQFHGQGSRTDGFLLDTAVTLVAPDTGVAITLC